MKIETNSFNAYSIFANENNPIFEIPPFQREYSWNKKNWETFFNDLVEFNQGYFIGSMIFVKKSSRSSTYQVIDGQQRLVTISILLLALYDVLKPSSIDRREIEQILFRHDGKQKRVPRLSLQNQNHNSEDYSHLLEMCTGDQTSLPKCDTNSKIHKAYQYFHDAIEHQQSKGRFNLLRILKNVQIVSTVVKSYPDASILFSSLNTRGIPLTTIDLIKNSLFSSLIYRRTNEKISQRNKEVTRKWDQLIEYLNGEHSEQIQERFFRQSYNAFKTEAHAFCVTNKKNSLPSEATRANLLRIYNELFKNDKSLNWCLENAKAYSEIINAQTNKKEVDRLINQLNYIEGSPSHTLLLYLYRKQRELDLTDSKLKDICKNLNYFFVRRKLTDKPATRELDGLFIDLIHQIESKKLKGQDVKKIIIHNLITKSASDQEFEKALKGNLYTKRKTARFVLSNLYNENKENRFWEKDKNQFIWTIEHIMPQTLSAEWKEKAFDTKDEEQIKQLHKDFCHTLGNLTLSGYNFELQNLWFTTKRDFKNDNGEFVGYKNGIKLNSGLKSERTWNIDKIKKRTDELCKQAIRQFSFK